MPQGIELSNLGKVFWPEDGLTKGDLLDYFEAVSAVILPALRDRPLTVKRFPDGIAGQSFFQKNTPAYAPGWVRTVALPAPSARRTVRYTVANTGRTLRWLANQAAVELHPWLSRTDRLDRPDHLVMDLDPPEGGFDRAVEAALLVREVLDGVGLEAAAKTSGAKGVHVYAPLERRYDYPTVRAAAVEVADRVTARAPDLATSQFLKADRGDRVFVDAGRNGPGAHVIAPYSPRARPGAPVSFPVPWPDLDRITPADFTIRSVPEILQREGDPWRELMPHPQRLPGELVSPERRLPREG